MVYVNYYNGDGDHFMVTYDPVTDTVDDGCYFFYAAGSVTHPKFAVQLHYGAVVGDPCRCPTSNGVRLLDSQGQYYTPSMKSIGYCSPTITWLNPMSTSDDLIGRYVLHPCMYPYMYACDPGNSSHRLDTILECTDAPSTTAPAAAHPMPQPTARGAFRGVLSIAAIEATPTANIGLR